MSTSTVSPRAGGSPITAMKKLSCAPAPSLYRRSYKSHFRPRVRLKRFCTGPASVITATAAPTISAVSTALMRWQTLPAARRAWLTAKAFGWASREMPGARVRLQHSVNSTVTTSGYSSPDALQQPARKPERRTQDLRDSHGNPTLTPPSYDPRSRAQGWTSKTRTVASRRVQLRSLMHPGLRPSIAAASGRSPQRV